MHWWVRVVLGILVVCGGAASGSLASAQDPPPKSQADKLFEQGMAKMDAGDFAAACPLLKQSLAVDYGMAAQFRLAECYEKLGWTASSWRAFRAVEKAANEAQRPKRAEVAAQRASKLEGQLMKIAVVVPDAARELPELTITLDGEVLPPESWGMGMVVDPGEHQAGVSASGYQPWTKNVLASNAGETQRVHVPPLIKTRSAETSSVSPAAFGTNKQGLIGLTVGGAGIIAMGVGGVLGLVAKSSYDGAAEHCTDNGCNSQGYEERNSARTTGVVGTVMVTMGLAATAAGAAVWFLAPADQAPSTAVLVSPLYGGAQVSVGGAF